MTPVHIRWTIRRDCADLMAIEREHGGWTEEQFIDCLRQRTRIALMAEYGELPVGHIVYALHDDHVELLLLSVHPLWLRQGIGRQLLDKAKAKISQHRRSKLIALVPEQDLRMQFFLKAMGLKADQIIRHSSGDEYRFIWDAGQQEKELELEPIFKEQA